MLQGVALKSQKKKGLLGTCPVVLFRRDCSCICKSTSVWKHKGVPLPCMEPLLCPPLSSNHPVPLQPPCRPCGGQYILYEAVKLGDSFPCQCGPHADPSVIYSTDPLALSSLITSERKGAERSNGESRWRNRAAEQERMREALWE